MWEVIKIANNRANKTNRIGAIEKYLIPLLVFGSCGFAGILVDADHLETIISNGLPIRQEHLTGRSLHILYFIFFGIVWLCSLAYVYRLATVVLTDKLENE